MGSGDHKTSHHHHLNFHIHLPHIHFHHHGHGHGGVKEEGRDVPKGCVAITVGQGAEQQRFVIPVIYINHPLFMQLLKAAEEEYGFDQKGPINIPCHVEEFRHVQCKIDQENHLHHHSNRNHHQFLCFRAGIL